MFGQGDSTLIRTKETTLMIDTGGSLDSSYDVGKNILSRYSFIRKNCKCKSLQFF